jgi:hypothetical protein
MPSIQELYSQANSIFIAEVKDKETISKIPNETKVIFNLKTIKNYK